MKTLTLIVPGLSQLTEIRQKHIENAADLPALRYLLAKSKQICMPSGFICALSHVLHRPSLANLSIAELTAVYDGLNCAENFWLRADPVLLQADLAAVYMYGNSQLSIPTTDLAMIKSRLEPLLCDLNVRLHMPTTKRWYLEL